jgi:phosphoribosylformylglycinamidine (FGAM) synthase-like enzyme
MAVALAEMAFAGEIGLTVDMDKIPAASSERQDVLLFSETASRLLVEVTPSNASKFEAVMGDTVWARIGECTDDRRLVIRKGKQETLSLPLDEMKKAWQKTLINL